MIVTRVAIYVEGGVIQFIGTPDDPASLDVTVDDADNNECGPYTVEAMSENQWALAIMDYEEYGEEECQPTQTMILNSTTK